MRTSILVVAAFFLTSVNARADGPWCAYYVKGATNCGFYSYEQCMADISGIGGSCLRNPAFPASSNSRKRK